MIHILHIVYIADMSMLQQELPFFMQVVQKAGKINEDALCNSLCLNVDISQVECAVNLVHGQILAW